MTRRKRLRITKQDPPAEPPAADDPALPDLPDPKRRRDELPELPPVPRPWQLPVPPRRSLPS
jgi:hypothetical protein